MARSLSALLKEVRSCEVCKAHLPLEPRPIVQFATSARVVIVGQAPGIKVHESGKPWADASGDHLRDWLGIEESTFYDPKQVALVPMGFCYPGKKSGGDAPPRKECAPLWHEALLAHLPDDRLVVLAGQYAHAYYLGTRRKRTLTDTVKAFEHYLPEYFALPHPSWRSKIWMKKDPWFERRVLPALRREIFTRLG